MVKIDFHYIPESPPCRTVIMVAKAINVELNEIYVNLFTGEQLTEEYRKKNPLGKVPYLVDGDLKLNESRAISRYLVCKYGPPDSPLYPNDLVKRTQIDELLDIDLELFLSGAGIFRPILRGLTKERDPEKLKDYCSKLKFIEYRLNNNGGKKFLLGDEVTLADISIGATLSFAMSCLAEFEDHKVLTDYMGRLREAVPNFKEVNDEPVEKMRKFLLSKLAE